MFSRTCLLGVNLYFLLAVPLCYSRGTYPAHVFGSVPSQPGTQPPAVQCLCNLVTSTQSPALDVERSQQASNKAPPFNLGEASRNPLTMGFSRLPIRRGSLMYKGRPTNFGASLAGRQGEEMSGDPSWMVKPGASSKKYGPSANAVVAGSTNIIYSNSDISRTGSRNYRPGTGETKGSMSYSAVIQPTKSSINFSRYKRHVTAKPVFGQPKKANPPASAKQSSAPVSRSTNDLRYRTVIGQSTGSTSYKPANLPLKASVDSGLSRPNTAKPACGKNEVKQVLVRPNLPAKPSSVSFGPYKSYIAKPALGIDEGALQEPVRPQSSVLSANPSSGSFRSSPPQWATSEASSVNVKQRWQEISKKSQSQRRALREHEYETEGERQNPAHSIGGLPQQKRGSILIIIPSHLGMGVLETVSWAEQKQRNKKGEPATTQIRPKHGSGEFNRCIC